MLEALELIHDDDPRARRCLRTLRVSPDYDQAFAAADPLVSVVIPTWNRTEELVSRAIPSVLTQTHQNVEVIVVGDAAPPSVATAVAAIGDSRVVYRNLTIRGPYPSDVARSWLASGTPGFNAGVATARGLWIAPLGDDDAFVPTHIERLLKHAREHRFEFVYGLVGVVLPDGGESRFGEFPPRQTQINLQAAIYHAGLRFLELELGHALFGTPNDWGLIRRMMRTGVRMGMVDELTVNYWPSLRTYSAESIPEIELRLADAERHFTEERTRAAALKQALADERLRARVLETRVAELTRRLDGLERSRTGRLTASLRRVRAKI
jgi:hypothetical protein